MLNNLSWKHDILGSNPDSGNICPGYSQLILVLRSKNDNLLDWPLSFPISMHTCIVLYVCM